MKLRLQKLSNRINLNLRKLGKEYEESDDIVAPASEEVDLEAPAEEAVSPAEPKEKQRRLTYDDAWAAFKEDSEFSDQGIFDQVGPKMSYYFNSIFKIYAAALGKRLPKMPKEDIQSEAYALANDFIYSPKFMSFNPDQVSEKTGQPVKFSTWVARVAVNEAEDFARKQTQDLSLDSNLPDGESFKDAIPDRKITHDQQLEEEDFISQFKKYLSTVSGYPPWYADVAEAVMGSGVRERRQPDEAYYAVGRALQDKGIQTPKGQPYSKSSILDIMAKLQKPLLEFYKMQGKTPYLRPSKSNPEDTVVEEDSLLPESPAAPELASLPSKEDVEAQAVEDEVFTDEPEVEEKQAKTLKLRALS